MRLAKLTRLVLGVLAPAGTVGCGDTDASCECAQSELQISGPRDTIQSVVASGPACASSTVTCGGPDETYRAGCDYYYVSADGEGPCVVTVTVNSGTSQSKTFDMRYRAGDCCAGYYSEQNPTWHIDE